MSTRTLHKISGASGPLEVVWVAALFAVACGSSVDRSPNKPDCAAADDYEFSTPLMDAEQGSPNHPTSWFGAGDHTPNCLPGVIDGVPVGNLTISDSGAVKIDSSVCTIREGTTAVILAPDDPNYPTTDTPVYRSLVFHSEGCTFWGSNASHTQPGTPLVVATACQYYPAPDLLQPTGYWDGSEFEGIAVWARSPGDSNHSVYLNINNTDTQLQTPHGSCNEPRIPLGRCTPPPADATAGLGPPVTDQQSGVATAGGVPARIPLPGECGNAFQLALETTPDWQLYTLPFSSFWQLPYPNRIATGLDASTILQIAVVFPREVRTELWITNFRFYRHKGGARDGGAN